MISLQQQMQQQIQLQSNQQNTLDRLEQRLCEKDDREKRTLEMGKSKVTEEEKLPTSEPILVGSVPLSRGISLIRTSSTPVKPQVSVEKRGTPQSSQTSITEGSKLDRDDHLTRKLKIPLFDGDDVDSWS